MKLIIGSNNKNKITEMKNILKGYNLNILSLEDLNIDIDVVEDGDTIFENSYKKAKEIHDHLISIGYNDFYVLSDDSGLMVDYLNGAPGVISKRFSGEDSGDVKNNEKVLSLMKDAKDHERSAKFITVLTLISKEGEINQFTGELFGYITKESIGNNGFGYDPIFYVKEFKKTLGELKSEEKNSISHRRKALNKLKDYMVNIL